MKRISACLLMALLAFAVTACGSDTEEAKQPVTEHIQETAEEPEVEEPETEAPESEVLEIEEEEVTMSGREAENALRLLIGENELSVMWEDNESVEALRELVKEQPLSIQMSRYGGFEQVGALGTNLPRNDVQTTTAAGDIVLYSGNQIVLFYGSNSWAYTRLGKVTNTSAEEMKELLGNGDMTITILE